MALWDGSRGLRSRARGLWSRWPTLRSQLVPGPRAWAGARRGVLLVAIGLFVASVWPLFVVPSFNWTALLPVLLLPLVSALAGGLLVLLSRLLSALPRSFVWTVASVLTAFTFLLGGVGKKGLWTSALYAVAAGALAGAGLASLLSSGGQRLRGLRRAVAVSGAA
ncbi:MAG TPA: hypothetical protein VMT70_12155, partial [Vicinamibacteria bacterium]|nr:hypothetical protein [Vicinamibacteria bacterium]